MKNNLQTEKKQQNNMPLQLLQASFNTGNIRSWIEEIQDADQQEMIWAEYYFFTGYPDIAVKMAEKHLDDADIMLRVSAYMIIIFGKISLGESLISQNRMLQLQKKLKAEGVFDSEEHQVIWIFISAMAKGAFDLECSEIPSMSKYLGNLPESVRVFGCYLMAHEAHLQGKYEKSLGIIETVFAICNQNYPILFIYLYLVAAADALNLKQIELGKKYFLRAWDFAKADGCLEPIGQYHGLLLGLVEVCIREVYPEDYKKIIDAAKQFGRGWMKIHHIGIDWEGRLTGMEYAVAMLAKRGWMNQEIATYLNISVRTVKYYMTSVFSKLNIKSRKEL